MQYFICSATEEDASARRRCEMLSGPYLSLRCALTHPEIVRALVLIDTQAMTEDPAKMPAYQAMLQDWAVNGLSDQTATIIETVILGDQWPVAAAWREKWKKTAPADLLQSFQTLGTRDDISDQIGRITRQHCAGWSSRTTQASAWCF